ncbi:MAG: protein kinase [Sandaracinaceae bacterium]|nr:protein kinase [Sandaracinaceae bacterium]
MSSLPPADPAIGTTIAGRYRLEALLGKGGMGVVYRAAHVATGRKVAVKLLARDADEAASQRFLREARIAASLSHPNLVQVIDVGRTEQEQMYLVLELLEGEPLSAHLRRKGPMRPEDALDTLVPILDALAALHAAGVMHRDVKPSNIFLSLDGSARVVPKLLDLGISKHVNPEEALTQTGMMMGTPHYMSPEQARGADEVGVGVDVWAMGVVLFEVLTGQRPFDASNVAAVLYKIASDRPPRLAEKRPGLPPRVAAAVDRALAYEPSSRFATAGELADALVEGAIDAGWTLTCRMPVGPRISLEPFAPGLNPPVDDRTPALGTATPLIPRPKSDRTREVSAALVASASGPRPEPTPDPTPRPAPEPEAKPDPEAATEPTPKPERAAQAQPSSPPAAAPSARESLPAMAEPVARGAAPAPHDEPRAAARPAPPPEPPRPQEDLPMAAEAEPQEEPITTPSERLRQLSPSPWRRLAPVLLVTSLVAGVALAVAWLGAEPAPRTAASPPTAVDAAVEAPPIASAPVPARDGPDAGPAVRAVVEPSAREGTVAIEPAPGAVGPAPVAITKRGPRPPHPSPPAATEPRAPSEPRAPTEPAGVAVGTNQAPIVD